MTQTGTLSRRLMTVPGVLAAAVVLTVTIPLWVPLAALVDLGRGKWRLPSVRLLAFGVCWTWLESIGVIAAGLLWIGLQSRNRRLHYRLQRWWSNNLLAALRITCGVTIDVQGIEALSTGGALLFVRHASLADSLVSAHVVTNVAGLRPRFVLKRELLLDPCLDIVGQRIPNYFLDRGASDSTLELAAVHNLVADLGPDDVGIIFPEGTRANSAKRAATLARIGERSPERAAKLAALQHLLPPRPSGTRAMTLGAPAADIVVAWHIGFEGLDSFSGILRALNRTTPPIRFVARRIAAADVPRGDDPGAFEAWLDDAWLRMDIEVGQALEARHQVKG